MILILLGMILLTLGCVEKPEQKTEMVLSNYPKLFEKDIIIVIGENATQINADTACEICVTCYLSDSRHSTSTKLSVSAVRYNSNQKILKSLIIGISEMGLLLQY